MSLIRFHSKSLGITVFSFLACLPFYGLHAQDKPAAIPANPLDQLSPTLRPLIQSAAANSWRMNLQDILVKRAEAFSLRSSAGKKPRVSFNANLGYQLTNQFGSDTEGINYRFNLSARQSLYSWGATEADHRFGLIEVKRVQHDRQLAFLAIYRDVVVRYINLEIARQKIIAQSIAGQIQQADVELRRAEVERGEFPATQFASIELSYDRAVLRLKQLDISFRKAEDFFKETIGVDESIPLSIENGLPAVPEDLHELENQVNHFIATLGDNSIKVLSKNARLEQELERLKRYKVNQRPKVNGLVRHRRDTEDFSTGTITDRNITETFAGFEFNWNLYDGRTSGSHVLESLESKRQLERELEVLKSDITDNLEFLLEDLQLQKKQVAIAEISFGWVVGQYVQIEKDVNAGRLPQKDLETAKRDLESERTKQMEARGVFFKSLTDLYVTLEAPSIIAYLEE